VSLPHRRSPSSGLASVDLTPDDLPAMYARRFSDADAARRGGVWREITRYLQRYIGASDVVLDLACDRGAFINHIRADQRWAVDVRDVREHLDPEVRFVRTDGQALLDHFDSETFDVVFMSNFLEHLDTADDVVAQLKVVHQVLKPGGRVIILQPNIRLVGGSYWDFLDHKTALTEKSLEEATRAAGLVTDRMVARFLPYTTKSRFPQHPLLVRAYLWFRPAWYVLGRQTLYIGQRPPTSRPRSTKRA
jgi:SAM-dependent methyltransferase